MPSPSVLIVGGGPAGSAAAFWLARAGHEVMLVEKKEYPRDKTCGDALTPRAILQLQDMGFDFDLSEFHKIVGLRSYAGEDMIEMPWPDHSRFPNWGGMMRRRDLDLQVARLAEKEGVLIRENTTATPVIDDGTLTSVALANGDDEEIMTPDVTIIADGSMNRFGRELGTARRKDYPMGLAARGYYSSPRSDDPFLESQLDLRDSTGATMPGYGWVFPLGDGTVNVGVGLLSTFKRWKHVNTTHMMSDYVATAPEYWGLTEESRLTKPVGGKLTMAFSKGPLVGSNWITIGDAAGAINPWNGEGISYAYETGRMAAEYVGQAVGNDEKGVLQRYRQRLDDEYGLYYKMARIFVKLIGHPSVMRTLAHTGLHNRSLMEWTLKVMANLLDEDEKAIGERAYDSLAAIVRTLPTP
ncbi:MAG: geranylgeranyl reductase family protein [Actinobacteria bacterium]|nr:geranylgeranyl reductase family protein [Actinomycetota bacterium]MCZ6738082.1 geranylgeranyl reductase family protein [Actinomycetota bacterium]